MGASDIWLFSFASFIKFSKVHWEKMNNKNYKMLIAFIIIYCLESLSHNNLINLIWNNNLKTITSMVRWAYTSRSKENNEGKTPWKISTWTNLCLLVFILTHLWPDRVQSLTAGVIHFDLDFKTILSSHLKNPTSSHIAFA